MSCVYAVIMTNVFFLNNQSKGYKYIYILTFRILNCKYINSSLSNVHADAYKKEGQSKKKVCNFLL